MFITTASEYGIRKVQENRGIRIKLDISFWSVLMMLLYWGTLKYLGPRRRK
jgi:hypothetical protein